MSAANPALPPMAAPRTCPQCHTPLGGGQEWCLECGAATGSRVVRSPSWLIPVAIVTAVVVLCAAALAIALFDVLSGSDDPKTLASNPAPGAPAPAPQPGPVAPVVPTSPTGPTGPAAPTGP